MEKIELLISKEVVNGIEDCDTYTPADGVKFEVMSFLGEGCFSKNAVVKLVWDIDGAPEILWSMKGSSAMPTNIQVERTGDGTKKLALCLDNGESGPVVMSGFAVIGVS